MKFTAGITLLLFTAIFSAHAGAQTPSQKPTPSPALATPSAAGQAQSVVDITNEPHHHLILENPYLRLFRVEIISPDATLPHRHTFPYVYMSIGKAEFTNAVESKPEVRVQLADGQLGYSKGEFVHVIRTENDTPFYNITVELLKPQGNVRSVCGKDLQGALHGCPIAQAPATDDSPAESAHNRAVGAATPNSAAVSETSSSTAAMTAGATSDASKKSTPPTPPEIASVLETDDLTLKSAAFGANSTYRMSVSAPGTLLVITPLSQFKVDLPDGSSKLLSGGDPLWLSPSGAVTITNSSPQKPSTLLLFSFKGGDKSAAR
ncbi:MAG: hypothetical protein M3N22_03395 [Acidobacteriota bacterium]|nr:hypothetical protein [Acidobacteriota bacterium]